MINKVKNIKRGLFLATLALTLAFSMTTAFALYYPDEFYSNRSWTYTYDGPTSNSYNCLGYATGSMTWEWPWYGTPTDSQVTAYLGNKGYTAFLNGQPYQAKIISYGTTSSVTHFSKSSQTLGSSCIAKWGGLERFQHGSWNPYNTGSDQWSSSNPYYGYWVNRYY